MKHIENLEQILTFILEETTSLRIIDILYERIKFMVEKYITLRDVENFMAYFEFILSTSRIPKKLKFEPKLMEAFVNRSYADLDGATQRFRAKKLFEYLEMKIGLGAEISKEDFRLLEIIVKQERTPTLDKLKERARIATILKWLQGPLKEQLSEGLQDYIIFLATAYGQFQTHRIFDVEWQPYEVCEEDTQTIEREYKVFKNALKTAIKKIQSNRAKKSHSVKGQEQFRVVLDSLNNLVTLREEGRLESIDAFQDKLIVSNALIYIQDEFVKKEPELEKFIQLLVSLYYQFRDEHYTTTTT